MIIGYSRAPLIPWTDSFSVTPSTDGSGFDGYTIRQVYGPSVLSASGSRVRLALTGGPFGGFSLDALYIGEQGSGNLYNMKASAPAPTQFLFSGSGSCTLGSDQTLFTDLLTFAIDDTKTYVIAAHINGTPDDMAVSTGTSVLAYQKAAVNEASTASVSGYTARPTGQAMFITKIQVAP